MKTLITKSTVLSLGAAAGAFAASVPGELETKLFAGPDKTPCPAVIAAAPTGEVYVGVDLQGSLGKKPNMGSIVRLVDTDNDGTADQVTTYAKIDNPRGIIPMGNNLIVLHCTQKDGKPHNQQISVFTDADQDGVADGPLKPLVKGIGNPKFIQSRGADHCTNNIRLGIDGWVYVSVGDFGFVDAEGSDGTKLTFHGGGVVRVRPDGSELESFIHGTRNVYDVAIDPFMNVFTRENTNDGVGWWVRFSHYIQSGEYGYPSLYTHFPEDMLPALGEYGRGSGTGSLYLQEPGWPAKYNNKPLLADWGRSKIYIHDVKPDGASFTNEPMEFIGSQQVADLDVDASGRMYVAAWAGAGYSGNKNKGYVDIVTPKGWKYEPFPKLSGLSTAALVEMLKSESITARTYASVELVTRKDASAVSGILKVIADKKALLEGRVAGIYTLAQLKGEAALPDLEKLSADKDLREHAIRAMTDRLSVAKQANLDLLTKALSDANPRVQVAAAVALGRTGNKEIADNLLAVAVPPALAAPKKEKGPDSQTTKTKAISRLKDKVQIKADISGFKELFLIVDAQGANGNDHAAFLNPTVTTTDGKTIDLTKVKWASASQGWGQTLVNKDCINKPLANGAKGIGTHAPATIRYKLPSNARTFTATGIMTKGSNGQGKVAFAVSNSAPKGGSSSSGPKPHSTPNSKAILPHIARQALLALDAEEACIAALNSADRRKAAAALSTMKFMHSTKVVDALMAKADTSKGPLKEAIVNTLIRLHQKENDYDGSTWWKTRPDPHGPYYYAVDWEGSSTISIFLNKHINSLTDEARDAVIAEIKRNKAYIGELNPRPNTSGKVAKKIGQTAIEDIVLHLQSAKGNAKKGSRIINAVGCAGCHNVTPQGIIKGPNLATLGNWKKDDLAEAIIKPAASIAESWKTITKKDGSMVVGTLVNETATEITLHDIAGTPTKISVADIQSRGPGLNMMSLHLCDSLTLQEFADLIEYIQSMDPKRKKKGKK